MLALLPLLIAASSAGAIPSSWIGTSDGSWDDPTRWTTAPYFPDNGTPSSSDTYDATIDAAGASYTVTLDRDVAVDSLRIDSADTELRLAAGTLATGNLEVQQGSVVLGGGALAAGSVQVRSGATLSADVTTTLDQVSIQVDAGGVLGVGGDAVLRLDPNVLLLLAGDVRKDVGASGNGRVRNRGTVRVDSGTPRVWARFFNQGLVDVQGGALHLNDLVNEATGQISVQGGAQLFATGVNQGGSMTASGSTLEARVDNTGQISVTDGSLRYVGQNDGTITATRSDVSVLLHGPNTGVLDLRDSDLTIDVFGVGQLWSDLGTLVRSGTAGARTTTMQGHLLGVDQDLVFDRVTGDLVLDGGGLVGPGSTPATVTFQDGTQAVVGPRGLQSNALANLRIVGDVDLASIPDADLSMSRSTFTGTARVGSGAILRMGIGHSIDEGTIRIEQGGLAGGLDFTLDPGSRVELLGGHLSGDVDPDPVGVRTGSLTNRAEIVALAGTAWISASEGFVNEGLIDVRDGSTLRVGFGPGSNRGTLRLAGAAVVDLGSSESLNEGTIEGSGRIEGRLRNVGTLAPGGDSAAGLLEFDSPLLLDAGSVLSFELGGYTPGSEYDRIFERYYQVELGGALRVSFLDGFANGASGEFTVLEATGGIVGAFDNVASGGFLASEGGERTFQVFYGAGSPFGADRLVLSLASVPEPGLALLLGAALACAAARRRGPMG